MECFSLGDALRDYRFSARRSFRSSALHYNFTECLMKDRIAKLNSFSSHAMLTSFLCILLTAALLYLLHRYFFIRGMSLQSQVDSFVSVGV